VVRTDDLGNVSRRGNCLLERLLESGKSEPDVYVRAASELETGMAALEGIARAMAAGERGPDISAQLLFVRGALHGALVRASGWIVEALGGMAFIRSPEVAHLAATVHALALHPPSRRSIASGLMRYHAGEGFSLA